MDEAHSEPHLDYAVDWIVVTFGKLWRKSQTRCNGSNKLRGQSECMQSLTAIQDSPAGMANHWYHGVRPCVQRMTTWRNTEADIKSSRHLHGLDHGGPIRGACCESVLSCLIIALIFSELRLVESLSTQHEAAGMCGVLWCDYC